LRIKNEIKALFGTREKMVFSHFYAIFPPFILKKEDGGVFGTQ